eukprot:TRINITY_DN23789_c0_g1_i1.p1 TRINITY_DN23789_c0_g1~~TRINITY_DN23789_c0_g1_i1.p1  ORF type:complete len:102 (+),score=7.90 TRINITY_DN23789_c0_g1_i1:91-396(+)
MEFSEGKQSAGQAGKSCAPSVVNFSLKEYNNNYFHNGLLFIDLNLKGNFPLILVKKQKPVHLAQGGYRDGTPCTLRCYLSLIHICRCRRYAVCRSRWSPDH